MTHPPTVSGSSPLAAEALEQAIRLRAYQIYLDRTAAGSVPKEGDALSDWLSAERDVVAREMAARSPGTRTPAASAVPDRPRTDEPDVVITRGRRGARPMGSARRARVREACTFTSPLPELRGIRQRGSVALTV